MQHYSVMLHFPPPPPDGRKRILKESNMIEGSFIPACLFRRLPLAFLTELWVTEAEPSGRISVGFDGGIWWSCSELRARSCFCLAAQTSLESPLSTLFNFAPFMYLQPYCCRFFCFFSTDTGWTCAAFSPNHTMASQISSESAGCE